MANTDSYYLYHRVPTNLVGETLYPLNTLKTMFPAIYEEHVKKYVGREELLNDVIPLLHCLWNDVLHLTAVPPQLLKKTLLETGRKTPFNAEFYTIDPFALDPQNTVVYLYQHPDRKDKFTEGNFIPYNPNNIREYATISETTKEYFKEMHLKNERPLLYFQTPHILFRGTLFIKNLSRKRA